jgi:predicted dehydrogenase
MRIGLLGTSEIAFRRFLPSLQKCDRFEFAGIASRDVSKTSDFVDVYGGKGYDGYNALLNDENIDCVYIPLPPSMHFEWANKALECGKHVFMEKPFTTSSADTIQLIEEAKRRSLAVHENYAFVYHRQIVRIVERMSDLGKVRLIRIDFGFPFRGSDDFRYDRKMGGGALLDCGGYTLKLASLLLGNSTKIPTAALDYDSGYSVDICGSATLNNETGLCVQLSFGMDNDYRCSLDIWGSKGSLNTNRIFTAPDGFEPIINLRLDNKETKITLEPDDSFLGSINHFVKCIDNNDTRELCYDEVIEQSKLVAQFMKLSGI